MEEYPISFPMEKARTIFRCSVITYLRNYHRFAITAATFVGIPFTFAILITQAILPISDLLPIVYNRLRTLFFAAGFPPTSEFFFDLSLKLSQTITSLVLLLPFTFSFHLLAKTYVVRSFRNKNGSYMSTFISLFFTQIWNSFLVLSANSLSFFLVSFTFSCMEGFGFKSPNVIIFVSASGGVLYSILLAHAYIISNLALVCSGIEGSVGGGYIAILRACVLIRGRTATALALALPISMAMTAIEALFHYRVMRAYRNSNNITVIMAVEGILIAYLYSTIFVLDTVVNCLFYRSCKGLNLAKIDGLENCSGDDSAEEDMKNLI
ncbi:uncharacterized protein LOC124930083 [Impatiens glandulifera]|uniref:uncharacterized protein LOC124930083 n=1 Tax=Impatiens glandulifera TaxID=253017 RepID=UPI001FB0B354|nr:uncharacterized protein LOC124930083 [Impatiens glandulifera]